MTDNTAPTGHDDNPRPHSIVCLECRAQKKCSQCGRSIQRQGDRCVNGVCTGCCPRACRGGYAHPRGTA